MGNEGKFKKYERTTQEQLQFFITFSRQYPDILKNSYGAKGRIHDLWNALADSLNDMRGPTRSADKWKECLKNRINQIRCRARKSMLGWNRRSTKRSHEQVDNTEDLDTLPEMEEQSSLMPTNKINYHETLSSSYHDDNIVKDEIPSIDLDSTDSNHSLSSIDLDTHNHFVNRELRQITDDQLKMFIAIAKQHCDVLSNKNDTDLWRHMTDTLNNIEGNLRSRSTEEWKESLLIWENQLRTRACFHEEGGNQNYVREIEQEALHLLEILAANEKTYHSANTQGKHDFQTLGFQQTTQETVLKNEAIKENDCETSDNEDITYNETTNVLNCDANSSTTSANNANTANLKSSSTDSLHKDFIDLLRGSLKKWDEREERAIVQQKLISNALVLHNKSLENMTSAIEKFNEKLDKL